MSLPSADATLTLTVPASTPMSPLPGSPLAKMVVPRTTRRVFIYEPRCSITAAGRSRNSEWLRSKDSLSRVRSAGRLPPGIDMSAPPAQTNIAIPTCALEHAHDNRFVGGSIQAGDIIAYGYRFWRSRLPAPGMLLKDAKPLNARWGCIGRRLGPCRPPAQPVLAPGDAKARRQKAPLCEPLHRQRPRSMAGSHA